MVYNHIWPNQSRMMMWCCVRGEGRIIRKKRTHIVHKVKYGRVFCLIQISFSLSFSLYGAHSFAIYTRACAWERAVFRIIIIKCSSFCLAFTHTHPYFNVSKHSTPRLSFSLPTFTIDFWTMTTKSDSLHFFLFASYEEKWQLNGSNKYTGKKEKKRIHTDIYIYMCVYIHTHRKEHSSDITTYIPQR